MPLTKTTRSLAICLALIAGLALASCSSDDNGDSLEPLGQPSGQSSNERNGSTATASLEQYCEVLGEVRTLEAQAPNGNPTPDMLDQYVDLLVRASRTAPSEARGYLFGTFTGDADALNNLRQFNATQCGGATTSSAP